MTATSRTLKPYSQPMRHGSGLTMILLGTNRTGPAWSGEFQAPAHPGGATRSLQSLLTSEQCVGPYGNFSEVGHRDTLIVHYDDLLSDALASLSAINATVSPVSSGLQLAAQAAVDEEQLESWAGKIAKSLAQEDSAAEKILRFVSEEPRPSDLISALCSALGRVETFDAKATALNVLTSLLRDADPYTRDSAALGLALLDDKTAVPALQQCMEREPSPMLRKNLAQVVEQLLQS